MSAVHPSLPDGSSIQVAAAAPAVPVVEPPPPVPVAPVETVGGVPVAQAIAITTSAPAPVAQPEEIGGVPVPQAISVATGYGLGGTTTPQEPPVTAPTAPVAPVETVGGVPVAQAISIATGPQGAASAAEEIGGLTVAQALAVAASYGLGPQGVPAGNPVPEDGYELDLDGLPSLENLLDARSLYAESAVVGKAFVSALVAACDLYGVEPQAAAAVAHELGLAGGIGNGGSSYGPWNLHAGKNLPTAYARLPLYSPKAQAWAWSATGIRYAVSNMARAGAKGKHGHAAVDAIAGRFAYTTDRPGLQTRSEGDYDLLSRQGAGWTVTVAGWAVGPAAAPASSGGTEPTTPGKTPAGFASVWRAFIAVFSGRGDPHAASVRRSHGQVESLASSYKGIFR